MLGGAFPVLQATLFDVPSFYFFPFAAEWVGPVAGDRGGGDELAHLLERPAAERCRRQLASVT